MKIHGIQSNQQIMNEVASRIKDRRIRFNLTQKELAKRAGVSPRTLTNIEEGQNFSFLTFIQLLKALAVIDNLNSLIPEPPFEPIKLLKLSSTKKRQRASKTNVSPREWKWGDES